MAGACALGNWGKLDLSASDERPALVVFWLNGGPAPSENGIYTTGSSFSFSWEYRALPDTPMISISRGDGLGSLGPGLVLLEDRQFYT